MNSFHFISSSILLLCYIPFLSFISSFHYSHLNLFYHYHFFLCDQILPLFFFFFISIFDLIFCFSPLNLNFCLHYFFYSSGGRLHVKKFFSPLFHSSLVFPLFYCPLLFTSLRTTLFYSVLRPLLLSSPLPTALFSPPFSSSPTLPLLPVSSCILACRWTLDPRFLIIDLLFSLIDSGFQLQRRKKNNFGCRTMDLDSGP